MKKSIIIGISLTTELLEWDGNGFWLHTKRLEKGHFKWPDGDNVMELNSEELNCLLDAPGVEQKLRRREIRCKNVY